MGINVSPNLYTGKVTPDILMPLVLSSATFENESVKLHSGINGKLVVAQQSVSFAVQNYTDDFNPVGTINQNLSDVVLQPVPMSLMMEIPKSDLFESYSADMLPAGIGINNDTYGTWVAQAISDYIRPQNSSNIEQIIWNGTLVDPTLYTVVSPPAGAISQIAAAAKPARRARGTANGTYAATAISAGGVLTMASTAGLALGDVITITNSTGSPQVDSRTIVGQDYAITALTGTTATLANYNTGDAISVTGSGTLAIGFVTINAQSVFTACEQIVKTLPKQVKYAVASRNTTLKWVVSPNVADAYAIRLLQNGNAQANYLDLNPQNSLVANAFAGRVINIYGYEALVIPGLAANTMVLYPADSIHVGMDIATDDARMSIIDLTPNQNVNKYSVRADWSLDTKITYPEQFSIISPLVA